MSSKKKLVITLSVLCVALALAIVGIVVVLVNTLSNVTNTVKVEFVADRVQVNVTGSYTTGGVTTPIKKDGVSQLVFSSDTKSDAFDSTGVIALSASSPRIVFEYTFTNTHDTVNAKVDLLSRPSHDNVTIGYAYSNMAVEDFDTLEVKSSYDAQLVCTGETKYIYIVVEVADLMSNARYSGTIQFGLGRVSADELVEVAFGVESNAVNSNLFKSFKALKGSLLYEPDIYPILENKVFAGWDVNWYDDDGFIGYDPTIGGTPFPITLSFQLGDRNATRFVFSATYREGTSGNLYESNGDGTCTFIGCSTYLQSQDLVIPDMYNGELVTKISDRYAEYNEFYSLLNGTIRDLYISNYVSEIPSYMDYWTTINGTIQLGRSVERLHDYAFRDNPSSKIRFNDNIRFIGYNSCSDASSGSYSSTTYINCYNNTEAAIIACVGQNNFDSIPTYYDYIALFPGSLDTYITDTLSGFPQNIKSIPDRAFSYNTEIKKIFVPSHIEYFGSNQYVNNTNDISTIVVSLENKYYDSRNNCNAVVESATDTIVFASTGCTTIPNTIMNIGEYAFCVNGAGPSTIKLPAGFRRLGSGAFSDCKKLKNIEFPSSLEFIGNNVFNTMYVSAISTNGGDMTNALGVACWDNPNKYVMISVVSGKAPADIPMWDDIVCFRDGMFNSSSGFSGDWVAPTSLNGLSYGIFASSGNFLSITLNDGLKYIGIYSLAYAGSVIVPESVEYIDALYMGISYGTTLTFADQSGLWEVYSKNGISDVKYMTGAQLQARVNGSEGLFDSHYIKVS